MQNSINKDIIKDAILDVYYLECQCYMTIIYTENLMSRHKILSTENANSIKEKIQKILDYFNKWNAYKNEKKKKLSKEELRSKTHLTWFLAPQSYLNLIIGPCGFFYYAHYVIRFKENLL